MTHWYWILLGGALGAWVRFRIGIWAAQRWQGAWPLATFCINVSGSFLLGMLTALQPPDGLRALLGLGLLGAYTTFSTFGVELLALIERRQFRFAVSYGLGSVIFGIGAAWLGWLMVY